jgi:mRNA-degrading endonuclease RelE of RelBE toxin-antitoxin system
MKIELADQVHEFVRSRPPESRRVLRDGLRRLAEEKGDIKPLLKELDGYFRLRVKSYRIIFRYVSRSGKRTIRCDFAEGRDVVYEAFLALLD